MNYDETTELKIENLIVDWRRLNIGYLVNDQKQAKQLTLTAGTANTGYYCMKYGFDFADPDTLYSVLMDEHSGSMDFIDVKYDGTQFLSQNTV